MSNKAKREYFRAILRRYRKASKKLKRQILDEFCTVCGYNRKYAIRLLSQGPSPPLKKRKGPKPTYGPEVIIALEKIWAFSGFLCSKNLKAAIPLWLPSYCNRYAISKETQELLLQISPATIDRALKGPKKELQLKGKCTTKPGSLLKSRIPLQTEAWDITKPGFVEADTLAHCGSSLKGDFVYTVNCVDISTTWTEQRAIWNKGQKGTLEAIKDIEKSFPFPLKGFHCDNGSEFLNHHLWRYFTQRTGNVIKFTRSRPNKKNDNAHIEQKQWSKVRQLFGYVRIDNSDAVPLMNDLYVHEWNWLQNFFTPSVKLVSKERIGAKIRKIHDKPKTPYQRTIESPEVPPQVKQGLTLLFRTLDPFNLRRTIESKRDKVFAMV